MHTNRVSTTLRERLGDDATFALLELFESEESTWSDRVLSVSADRFERRLAEEVAGLRVALVREMHDGRVEMLKWGFAFWVGQIGIIAGLRAFMFRVTGR